MDALPRTSVRIMQFANVYRVPPPPCMLNLYGYPGLHYMFISS